MKPLVFNKLRFLPLICLVFGIICLILSTTVFSSKTIQLTKTSFPKYGSPEQGSSNGWVQLKAIKMEYLGYTESDSLVKYKNGRIDSNYTKNFLYFVTDFF